MTAAIVGLLAMVVIVLTASGLFRKTMPAGPSDWVILEWREVPDAGDSGQAGRDSGPPINIQFIPVIGWEAGKGGMAPVTPSGSQASEKPGAGAREGRPGSAALRYWIRDGAVYDLSDMSPVDFWTDLFNHAYARTRIVVHGNVPDTYRKRLFDIVSLSEKDELDVNLS